MSSLKNATKSMDKIKAGSTPPESPPIAPVSPGESEFEASPDFAPVTGLKLKRTATGLPVPANPIKDEVTLQEYFDCLTPDDWGHIEVYVYQKWPVHRKRPHGHNNLMKITEGPFNVDAFLAQYGSGNYKFDVNDSNVAGKFRTAAQILIKYRDPERPPTYNLDWLDLADSENRTIVEQLQREGKINSKGEVMSQSIPAQPGEDAGTVKALTGALLDLVGQVQKNATAPAMSTGRDDGTGKAMDRVVEMMAAAGKQATDMALAQVKQQDPAALLQLMTAMREFNAPVRSEGDSGLVKLLMEQNAALQKQTNDLMLRLIDAKQAPAPVVAPATGGIGMLKEFLQIKELLGGSEMGTPKDWKEMLAGAVADNLPGVLEVAGGLFANLRGPAMTAPQLSAEALQGGQGAVAQQQLRNNPVQAVPQPQPPVDMHAAATGAGTGAATGTDTPKTPEQIQLERLQLLVNDVAAYGNYFLNALRQGTSGDAFAESIIQFTSMLQFERMAGYSVDEWMTAIYAVPQMKEQLTGAEQTVYQFVTDFLSYGQDGDGDGNGDGESGVGVDGTESTSKRAPVSEPQPTPINQRGKRGGSK